MCQAGRPQPDRSAKNRPASHPLKSTIRSLIHHSTNTSQAILGRALQVGLIGVRHKLCLSIKAPLACQLRAATIQRDQNRPEEDMQNQLAACCTSTLPTSRGSYSICISKLSKLPISKTIKSCLMFLPITLPGKS